MMPLQVPVLPQHVNGKNPLSPLSMTFVSEILFASVILFLIIFSYFFISSEKNMNIFVDTPLGISLQKNSHGLITTMAVCTSMCTIGVLILLDYFFDIYIGRSSDVFNDQIERNMISAMSFVPAILPIFVSYGRYDDLPYVFALVNSIQLCGYAFALLRILNRVYPLIFTPLLTQFMSSLTYISVSFTLFGFGKREKYWSNLTAFMIIVMLIFISFNRLRKVFIEFGYTHKRTLKYTSEEVYSMSYLMLYSVTLSILFGTSISFQFTWTKFDLYGVNIFNFTMLLFTALVYSLPSKIASIRQFEIKTKIQKERHEFDEARISAKQHTIRYLSHEIRTPITIAKCCISFALENMKERREGSLRDGAIIDLLEDGLHACDGTVTVLNDMLSYEAMEAGKYQLFPEFTPAISTVKTILANIKSIGSEKNIKFIIENKLGDSTNNCFFYFDLPKMEQVFRNLASNSIKFSGLNNDIKVVIHRNDPNDDDDTSTLPSSSINVLEKYVPHDEKFNFDGNVSISFIDNGIGISADNINKVFGEFSQFDPNKLQGGGGTGLGLHISRNIIICHGGTIKVSSDGIGHGTAFTMTFASYRKAYDIEIHEHENEISNLRNVKTHYSEELLENVCTVPLLNDPVLDSVNKPIIKLKPDSQSIVFKSEKSAASVICPIESVDDLNHGDRSLKKFTVLVVDDSRLCRKLTMECFRREFKSFEGKYELVLDECEDGIDAVNMVMNNKSYDIVCMDNVMLKMGGLEATRSIRGLGFDGKIVAISGNVLKCDIDPFMEAGADFFLSKPISRPEISKILEQIICCDFENLSD